MTELPFLPTDPNTSGGPKATAELEVLLTVVRHLQSLSPDAQQRVIGSALTFLGLQVSTPNSPVTITPKTGSLGIEGGVPAVRFSEDRTPSPKDFLFEKRPTTDVERIACLAYYLTHYRDTPHFKTLDLSKLNTDAAQLKLGNPGMAVDNATKAGLLVPASKGTKQMSSLGELYVQALPDKNAARAAIAHARPRRRNRRGAKAAAKNEPSSSGE